ncbi:restriction endonuclease [Microbispora hainanensis]|uniref:restriction endonuclease n=1 Tax=Microbispora hainanensis TaxID=568844 RepID=UPI0033D60B0C
MTGSYDAIWQALFATLDALPANSSSADKQRRGNQFEQMLYMMFEAAGMEPRTRYRPTGEEIDGSFLHRGRPMLLEAKWTSEPVPASTLYQFRGKVDGKLMGTLGLFISMAGYSSDAVDALVAGKTLNLILFDGDDMRKVAQPNGIDIGRALDLKLRAAAEEGTPFVPLQDPSTTNTTAQKIIVIVEGNYDARIVSTLARLHRRQGQISVIPAMGRLNLPLVAQAQLHIFPEVKELVIIADGDGIPAEVRLNLERAISPADTYQKPKITLVVLEPDFETALGLTTPGARRRPEPREVVERLPELNLLRLAESNPELARLFYALRLLKG